MSITIPAPRGIDAAGRESGWWVPAIANPTKPTVAEITAGINLSCALYGFETSVDQPTTTTAHLCDVQPVQRPGRATYSVGTLVVDDDPQHTDSTGNYEYLEVIVPGAQGFLVRRRGLLAKRDAAVVAAQYVDVIPADIGTLNRVSLDPTSTDGGTLRNEYAVFVTGQVEHDVKVVA